MDIDAVLATGAHSNPPGTGQVIVAASAQELLAGIRRRLGAGGRIGRLRIVDSFGGSNAAHPLKSATDLSELRGLFAPGGRVELFAGPASGVPGKAVTGFGGGMGGGFGGGFSGAGISSAGAGKPTSLAAKGISLDQLSSALGVPVTWGGR